MEGDVISKNILMGEIWAFQNHWGGPSSERQLYIQVRNGITDSVRLLKGQEEIDSKALMAGPALFRGRIRSPVVSRRKKSRAGSEACQARVWRQGCLLSAKEKGVGWRSEEDGECLKSLLQSGNREKHRTGRAGGAQGLIGGWC